MILAKETKRMLLDDVDVNWTLTERETDVFREMWENVKTIANQLRRPMLEIWLLIIEQAELGEIEVRRHGMF